MASFILRKRRRGGWVTQLGGLPQVPPPKPGHGLNRSGSERHWVPPCAATSPCQDGKSPGLAVPLWDRPLLPAPHPQVLGHMLPLPPGEVIYQKGHFLPIAKTLGGCRTLTAFCQHLDASPSAFNPGSFLKAEQLSTPNHPPKKTHQPYSSHTRSLSPTPSLTPGSEQGLETGSAARCHQHFN